MIENGPGVCVRWEGRIYPPSPPKFEVSSRSEVGFNLVSKGLYFAVWGEAFSIAAAYAFESVLKAVGEDGSTSPFSAVTDFPRVWGRPGVLI